MIATVEPHNNHVLADREHGSAYGACILIRHEQRPFALGRQPDQYLRERETRGDRPIADRGPLARARAHGCHRAQRHKYHARCIPCHHQEPCPDCTHAAMVHTTGPRVHRRRHAALTQIHHDTEQAPFLLRLVAQPALAHAPTCRVIDPRLCCPVFQPCSQTIVQQTRDHIRSRETARVLPLAEVTGISTISRRSFHVGKTATPTTLIELPSAMHPPAARNPR